MSRSVLSRRSCQACATDTQHRVFADPGLGPLVSDFVAPEAANQPETFYPLTTYVCGDCKLVYLPESISPEKIFSDYPTFSSVSAGWLRHSEALAAHCIGRFGLDANSLVLEPGSNDGYLLQYFMAAGIPVLGVEPAANVAHRAAELGIPTEVAFFGRAQAENLVARGVVANLVIGNNVLGHVPDLDDFLGGVALVLADDGVTSFEFCHLLRIIEGNQVDQIIHEHFGHLSLLALETIAARHGLSIFDVAELDTHGGSLRVHAQLTATGSRPVEASVTRVLDAERAHGLDSWEAYEGFRERSWRTKHEVLANLIELKRDGRSIVGYGAAGKGAILAIQAGLGPDFLDYVVDLSPHKQGLLMPGLRLPIHAPDMVRETKPDFLYLLAWRLRDEIMEQMSFVRDWGGQFIVPLPEFEIIP